MMMTRCPEAYRFFCNPVKVMGIFVASLVGFLVWFSAMSGWPSYGFQWSQKPGKEDVNLDDIIEQIRYIGDSFPQPVEVPKDKLLGGLFPEGLDVNTCVSRYQSALYRKEQKHQPSPNLVSRLRKYEALHKQCGPFTESYNRTLEYLKSGNHGQDSNSTGCKYYNINLARADEKIGIQIRVLDKDFGRFERVLNQTLGCMLRENLLPEINGTKPVVIQSGKLKTKALLITSLRSWYSEAIKSMYWKRSTVTGEVVEVHQPSHEQYQHTRRRMHNIKAWAEIYLLSLTDKLVTSGGSTFGYIAHSLGGLKPWILYKPEDHVIPNPPCQRGVSMEPCMHAPPYYDCTSKKWTGPGGKLDPNVQHCDDKWWGIKFIDRE
ncbi:galactoside 2-alpha-L-fucosyltransferase-like isoform X2 [Coffea arabica]|uniref:Fucosyltransferase n=1 Tax=Coffea arabica TaxID=13443 RepID=A0ABM4U9T6_COFAR